MTASGADGGRTAHVVILGGGSAGWITAGLLAAERGGADGVQVTLIESPDIPIIGVGEGTWPSMRATLQKIGLAETEIFRACDAAFKQGAKFARWVTGEDDDYYYHPLVLPQGFNDADLASPWLAQMRGKTSFADAFCCQSHLCEHGLAPKQISTPEYASVANYAYHLDAVKLGTLLQKHCTGRLGVRHVVGRVAAVREAHPGGDIAALQLADGGELCGDLFVDCSGMRSYLLGSHYGIKHQSCRGQLFNDRAIAVQVPYPQPDAPIATHTISTAHRAGWIWDIGLPTRKGVGIVYASDYMDDTLAERTVLDYAAETLGDAAHKLQTRRIDFDPGHRSSFWHRNCVAIGLSAGFLEPLEASALVLVESSAAMLAEDFPANRRAMDMVAARFNKRMRYYWDSIVDFLKLHYILSRRQERYWRDHRAPQSASERLGAVLDLWRHRVPNRHDFPMLQEMFPAASWHYVLYGMGFETDVCRPALRPERVARVRELHEENLRTTGRMVAALPGHRQLIDKILEHGMQPV